MARNNPPRKVVAPKGKQPAPKSGKQPAQQSGKTPAKSPVQSSEQPSAESSDQPVIIHTRFVYGDESISDGDRSDSDQVNAARMNAICALPSPNAKLQPKSNPTNSKDLQVPSTSVSAPLLITNTSAQVVSTQADVNAIPAVATNCNPIQAPNQMPSTSSEAPSPLENGSPTPAEARSVPQKKKSLPQMSSQPTSTTADHNDNLQSMTRNFWSSAPKTSKFRSSMGRMLNGEVTVGEELDIPDEVLLQMDNAWGVCLIGYVAGRFPGKEAIESVRQSWNVNCRFSTFPSGWILYKFLHEEDRESVLSGGPYYISGSPLLLKKIPKHFDLEDPEAHTVPIWVRIIHLPLQMWSEPVLSMIGARIGKGVYMDQLTETRNRIAFARILVEVDSQTSFAYVTATPHHQTYPILGHGIFQMGISVGLTKMHNICICNFV